MLCQDGVDIGGDGGWEGGSAPLCQIGVGAEGFQGGREFVLGVVDHKKHEVDALGGAPQKPSANGEVVALMNFGAVVDEVLQGERAALP